MPRYMRPWTQLAYPSGHIRDTRASGFTTIHVYCLGRTPAGERCRHGSILPLAGLPDLPWPEICRRLACTACDSVGHVSIRVNWGEVIDFTRSTLGRNERP